MIKTYSFLLFLSIAFFTVRGQIPAGYYDSANGLNGDALKTELNNIIDGHTELSYDYAKTALRETDEDTFNSNNVICFYTGWSYGKFDFGNGSEEWNREHVWSKSHGDFGDSPPAGTDIHQLRPTDASVNSAKSNRDFDIGIYQYFDGSGETQCYKDTDIWEPRDEVKGDVARIIFYMATRYEGENGEVDLEIVDYVNTAGTTKEPLYGKLNTLLQWHIDDPVDDWEINRNNIVYNNYQYNRNPFIDHPEYVNSIWGSTNPEPTNHVLSFVPGSPTSYSISLSWDDNDGTNLADKFLILINTSGSFSNPVDGTEQNDDTDLSDGNGKVNINHGDETYNFTGLIANTTYYFKIFPYSNFGTTIDYKTDGSIPATSATTAEESTGEETFLFISEVADPNDAVYSKYVELYNAGDYAINFDTEIWYLCRQANGDGWGDIQLSGFLPPHETLVLSYNTSSFFSSYGFDADITSGYVSGNGNDGYFLYFGGNHTSGTLVDAYGIIDEDGSGKIWEYSNSKAVRKRMDTIPSPTWQAASWIINSSANDEEMTPDWHKRTLNWTGAQSSVWENKENWSDAVDFTNYEPDVGCKVVIPFSSTPPIVSSNVNVGSLELEPNATITVASGVLHIEY